MIAALLLVTVCAVASDNCQDSIAESWHEPTMEEMRDCATMAGSMGALYASPVWTNKHKDDTRFVRCELRTLRDSADGHAEPAALRL